jgi:hypothetical protein
MACAELTQLQRKFKDEKHLKKPEKSAKSGKVKSMSVNFVSNGLASLHKFQSRGSHP